ncbi:MAG: dihydrolipoyl dehydrogenase [Sulfolobales archaeon]|nr:dihydrolipoyl dehydrogenase [Sulfolobales archaeon]
MAVKVVVIGSGPAGYVAAIRAAQLGGNVTVIERESVGGVCVNRGCIPTKALTSITSAIKKIKQLKKKGIINEDLSINIEKVFASKNSVRDRLIKGVEYLLSKSGVQVVRGEARIVGHGVVEVGGDRMQYDKLIIATGSLPTQLNIEGIDSVNAVSGEQFINMDEVPPRLLIIGGGPIGIELAQIYNTLGSEVNVVEIMPHILPNIDGEVSITLQRMLTREGIKIHTNTSVHKFERASEGVYAYLSNGVKIIADRVVLAVGRKPNTSGLGVESLGVKLGRKGEIQTNEHLEAAPNVYAAGDVVGRHFLAYTAFEEGIVAAENALGLNSVIKYGTVPTAIFTDPEVASVGVSEEEAKKLGDVLVGKFPLIANGRALTLDSYGGFIKIIANKKGKLLGMHMVGPEASELIHIASIILSRGGNAAELLDTLYVHPTISEGIKEAVLSILKKPIHI